MGLPGFQLADIDLSDYTFWGRPPAEREASFALLRAQPRPVFFAEPEGPAASPSLRALRRSGHPAGVITRS